MNDNLNKPITYRGKTYRNQLEMKCSVIGCDPEDLTEIQKSVDLSDRDEAAIEFILKSWATDIFIKLSTDKLVQDAQERASYWRDLRNGEEKSEGRGSKIQKESIVQKIAGIFK